MKLLIGLLVLLFSTTALADRVGVNQLSGTVTLTEQSCNLNIVGNQDLHLAIAKIIVDGEQREVLGCYMETFPPTDGVDTAVSLSDGLKGKYDITFFGMVTIFTEEGKAYSAPSTDFKYEDQPDDKPAEIPELP